MEEMIFSKSENDQGFLSYLLLNRKEIKNLKEITDWLETEFSFEQQALKKLMGFDNETRNTLLHYFAVKDVNGIFLIEILNWIQDEFGMEYLVEICLKKDCDGDTILSCIGFSQSKNVHLMLIEVLNHLKIVFKNDRKQFGNLIISSNNVGETILHIFCKRQKNSNLENFISTFIEWCNENLAKSQLEDLLFAENNEDKIFLSMLLLEPNDDSDINCKECLKIFCKTVIQLHEMIENKEKLKNRLQKEYIKSLNLIEFVAEYRLDFGFFNDWLEQHPEYPAPSELKQMDELESNIDVEQSSSSNQFENAIESENQIEISSHPEKISIERASISSTSTGRKSQKKKCICL